MVIRQLKQSQYDYFHRALINKAYSEPLDASFTVNMTINDAEYAIKIQPEKNNKIAVIQALRIYREETGLNFELITSGNLLSSFLDILVYQGIK